MARHPYAYPTFYNHVEDELTSELPVSQSFLPITSNDIRVILND